ncbi:MAG: hypothetical protein BroJett029_23360 [Alphaproteobacteria bacterium]|nr:MAG: hypothetical protein BroJett029_23360 [Alphaproteobacteria bacterium]
MRTVVLTVAYPNRASYYEDWRDAFATASEFDSVAVNLLYRNARRRLADLLGSAELIVLLHSCTADTLDYLRPITELLQARRCPLLAFVGNEVNLPWAPLGEKIAWLKSVGPELIATQLGPDAGQWLYEGCGARVIAVPHALNAKVFHAAQEDDGRPVDIGARGFRYSPYVGDDDRNRIHVFFAGAKFDPALQLDIKLDDRLDRLGWAGFLRRCKGTISTEAGSRFLERNDATVLAVRSFLNQRSSRPVLNANSPLHRWGRRLPYGVKALLWRILRNGPLHHEATAFDEALCAEVLQRFFSHRREGPVSGKCISSRHFDAIGTRTCQIMFPGRFNDILQADIHYISLVPDFSNLDDALARFRDVSYRMEMTRRTYEYAMDCHTYRHRIAQIAAAVTAL